MLMPLVFLFCAVAGKFVSRNGDCGRPGAFWFILCFVLVTRLLIMPMLGHRLPSLPLTRPQIFRGRIASSAAGAAAPHAVPQACDTTDADTRA